MPPSLATPTLRRLGLRGVVGLLLALQVLAPWLHAHTRGSRAAGFHLHVAGAVAGAEPVVGGRQGALVMRAVDALSASDESPSVGMPGGWLRDGDPADAAQPALAARPLPPAAGPTTVGLRIGQQQAPRPPPAFALVAYASQAPPAASLRLTRG